MKATTLASGTTPPVSGGEVQAARWVQGMFAGIAVRYDLLNRLLSFNIDRNWRHALLAFLQPALGNANATVLDLCCGTGDVLLALEAAGKARVLGADFCHPMLLGAQRKLRSRKLSNSLLGADALTLPFAGNSLDAIAIAFGFRNLANYRGGLAELHRVLKPGGRLAILEFSHPPNALVRFAYSAYSRLILPVLGGLISGSLRAYMYLPESIRKFPRASQLAGMMEEAGFREARFQLLTFGIAALHTARKN